MNEKDTKRIEDFLADSTNANVLDNANKLLNEEYGDSITVEGKNRYAGLIAVYCLAEKNVLSNVVLQFLKEIDDTDVIKSLTNNEFLELATAQKKATKFNTEVSKIFRERKKQQKELEKEAMRKLAEIERKIKAESMPSYFQMDLCQDVVERILTESLNIRLKYNQVTKRIDIDGSGKALLLEKYSEENILNILPTNILDECKICEVLNTPKNGTGNIKNYLLAIADINRYNPIQEMLKAHKNSNPKSLEKIYKILDLTLPFDKLLVKKWLIQTVAFAFATKNKPVSTEGILTLQGKQGLSKTSFFRKIAGNPSWFSEGACIDVNDKDSLINAVSTWICELGEIESTLNKDQPAFKAFVTRQLDSIRVPYAATPTEMPRTTSLCGTVNKNKFLRDETGNRRYWIVSVNRIDKNALFNMGIEEVYNLWGYIYSLYLENEKGYLLNDVEREQVEMRNLEYMVNVKHEDEIKYLLNFYKPVEKWEWVSPAEIANKLKNTTAEEVGRVFSKVMKEERNVIKNRNSSGVKYLLPIEWDKITDKYYKNVKYY